MRGHSVIAELLVR